ncbi:MAG: hypothetical protein J3Q66DRAFT_349036 [Benniella sp.]|nr:MAG: hypothetical protein J3Q66DRAFT_349018 [Benniella sp.]KAK3811976.1 MAG: hypothetical protein J3Q66DRAFT_349036 [Benniella sp.]
MQLWYKFVEVLVLQGILLEYAVLVVACSQSTLSSAISTTLPRIPCFSCWPPCECSSVFSSIRLILCCNKSYRGSPDTQGGLRKLADPYYYLSLGLLLGCR